MFSLKRFICLFHFASTSCSFRMVFCACMSVWILFSVEFCAYYFKSFAKASHSLFSSTSQKKSIPQNKIQKTKSLLFIFMLCFFSVMKRCVRCRNTDTEKKANKKQWKINRTIGEKITQVHRSEDKTHKEWISATKM